MLKSALIAGCLTTALLANAVGGNSAYRPYLRALQEAKASEARLAKGQDAAMARTAKVRSFLETRHLMVAETLSEARHLQQIVDRLKAVNPPPDCTHVHGQILRCFGRDVLMARNIARSIADSKSPDEWDAPLQRLKADANREREWRKAIDRELAQIFSRHNLPTIRFSPGKS